jgi:Ca2+-transporting ATPase
MITGDFPATAVAVAGQAGIDSPGSVIVGAEIDGLSDDVLAARVGAVNVFARIAPRQKLRLVNALRARGEVVAMTGDGVNDAPALKAAHIGVAMGARGSDVAREAADLVLLDDSFESLVEAVRLGRRIYANIRKATSFILAVHVPIAGLSLLPVLAGDWPLLLLPVHIVFLELVIDPTCALVFEAERADADLMRRPPRPRAARLFAAPVVTVAVLQGLSVLAACVAVFLLARPGHGPDAARALTFAALVVSTLVLIVVNRSWGPTTLRSMALPNRPFWIVAGVALAQLGVALGLPAARELFSFAALHPADLALSLGAGLACLAWFELIKRTPWWRRWR